MKIKIIKPCGVNGKTFTPGEELDVSKATANLLIATGKAVSLEPKKEKLELTINVDAKKLQELEAELKKQLQECKDEAQKEVTELNEQIKALTESKKELEAELKKAKAEITKLKKDK